MASYKLTYFNLTGVAEPIRYLLSYGNKQFEDIRIEFNDWPAKKNSFPLGKLPIFEVDGKSFTQSVAIARYVAKQVKLTGKNDLEDLVIEAAVDTVIDARNACAKYYWEQNPEVKKTLLEPLQKEHLPVLMDYIEKLIKENGGYVALGRLTWADLYLVSAIKYLSFTSEIDVLKSRPNLTSLVEKVQNISGIKAYLKKTSNTPF